MKIGDIAGSSLSPKLVDLSDQIDIIQGHCRLNRATWRFVQAMSLTNMGDTITGPLWLVLDNLSSNAKLLNATGVLEEATSEGSPYIELPARDLPPGLCVTIIVEFANPSREEIRYDSRVLSLSAH